MVELFEELCEVFSEHGIGCMHKTEDYTDHYIVLGVDKEASIILAFLERSVDEALSGETSVHYDVYVLVHPGGKYKYLGKAVYMYGERLDVMKIMMDGKEAKITADGKHYNTDVLLEEVLETAFLLNEDIKNKLADEAVDSICKNMATRRLGGFINLVRPSVSKEMGKATIVADGLEVYPSTKIISYVLRNSDKYESEKLSKLVDTVVDKVLKLFRESRYLVANIPLVIDIIVKPEDNTVKLSYAVYLGKNRDKLIGKKTYSLDVSKTYKLLSPKQIDEIIDDITYLLLDTVVPEILSVNKK